MRCTAKAKSTGKQCERGAMQNGVCYVHGGPTPVGLALPQTTHGRYSKAMMPPLLRERAEALLRDNEYLSLREEFAYHDAETVQVYEEMERGEAGPLWPLVVKAWDAQTEARQVGDNVAAARYLNEVGRLIKRGYKDHMARRELLERRLARAKLVEAEGKRIERAQASIKAPELMLVVDRLMEIVSRNVADRRQVSNVISEFMALLRSAPYSLASGGGQGGGEVAATE